MLLVEASWYITENINTEFTSKHSALGFACCQVSQLFYRAGVLTSNDSVLVSFLKKKQAKSSAATCSCLPVQVQNQASASSPYVTVGRPRESYFLNTHCLSTRLLTAQKSDGWTDQREEGDLSFSSLQDPGWQGRPRPRWRVAIKRYKVLIRRQPSLPSL